MIFDLIKYNNIRKMEALRANCCRSKNDFAELIGMTASEYFAILNGKEQFSQRNIENAAILSDFPEEYFNDSSPIRSFIPDDGFYTRMKILSVMNEREA